jgi:hypothetical protein
MFAALFEKLGALFSPSRHDERHAYPSSLFPPSHFEQREAYLASSSDLVDLERRMRHLDRGFYSFSLHSSVMPRDNEL